jgi:ABC-2 type transport system ATP-binding protein
LHEVGALLDAKAVHPSRSAYHHLLALAQSNRIPAQRVDVVLDMVGLRDVAARRVGKFSLGMSQRLGIAAALLGDPPILMFDEPVNGLDPEGIVWIRTLLKGLADEGRTIFISSHLMTEMAMTADELLVIGRGRLIASGTIAEIVGANHASVLVRTPATARLRELLDQHEAQVTDSDGALVVRGLDAQTIGEVAFAAGIVVHELSPQHDSLEDAYFRLTDDSVDFHAHDSDQTLQEAS